jgi:hypothetical protein
VGYRGLEDVVGSPYAAVQREAHGALALREELLGEDVGHDHNSRRLLDASKWRGMSSFRCGLVELDLYTLLTDVRTTCYPMGSWFGPPCHEQHRKPHI